MGRRSAGGAIRVWFVVTILGAVIVVSSLALVVLTRSVTVYDTSMAPTIQPEDRLGVALRGGDDLRRFDLVEIEPVGGDAVRDSASGKIRTTVSRLIGLPGDRISVQHSLRPTVLVKPAGTTRAFRVDNPAWPERVASADLACCGPSGAAASGQRWVKVPAGSYWVVGDNWAGGIDSRSRGFIRASVITSKLTYRVLPLSRAGSLSSSARLVPLS